MIFHPFSSSQKKLAFLFIFLVFLCLRFFSLVGPSLVPRIGNEVVEVPHVVPQSEFQQHPAEQTVEIPDHGGVVWARKSLQGPSPGQSSTASSRGGLLGFPSGQGSTAPRRADPEISPGFSTRQGSTARRGADLAVSPGFLVRGQVSTALRGDDLHGDLQGLVSKDRVQQLVVVMIFLHIRVGDAWTWWAAVCTFGMCTRARRNGCLHISFEEDDVSDEFDGEGGAR